METNNAKTFLRAPYFDDYDIKKGYYKILFKPGVELQTRELNQIQSSIQEQIARLGRYVYKNGSIVYGCENRLTTNTFSAVLDDTFYATNIPQYLHYFDDMYVVRYNTNQVAKISFAIHSSENPQNATECVIIYSMISGDPFPPGSNLVLYDYDNKVPLTDYQLKIATDTTSVQRSCFLHFNSGVIFLDGYFLFVPEQRIVIDIYTNTPSVSVGLIMNEKIVTHNDNATLYDNSYSTQKEYYNYAEPGADRLQIIPTLTMKPVLQNTNYAEMVLENGFLELIRIEQGVVVKNINIPIYSEVGDKLAWRTFDQSGHYTVKPFKAKIIKHINHDPKKFSIEISPGKAYVSGYEFDSIAKRYIDLDRALEFEQKQDFVIPTYYGSYVIINNMTGFFDVQKCCVVNLLSDTKANLNTINKVNAAIMGTARVRHVVKVGANFWIYIFNTQLNGGKNFAQVKSIRVKNTTDGDGWSDLATSEIHDANTTSLLFKLPEDTIRTIRASDGTVRISYTIQKSFPKLQFVKSVEPSAPDTVVYASMKVPYGEQFLDDPTAFLISNLDAGTVIVPDGVTILTDNSDYVQLRVDGTTFFTGSVLARVLVSEAKERTADTITSKTTAKDLTPNQEIILNDAHIGVKLTSVIDPDGNDITNLFHVNQNEDDHIYESVSVTYIGQNAITGKVDINYTLENYSNTGFFTVDSFTDKLIADGKKKNGDVLIRSQHIDFRTMATSGTITNAYIPVPDGLFICDYSYYLSRVDKLVISPNKNFELIRGIPSLHPSAPFDRPECMTLYIINVSALSDQPDSVNLSFIENKRYTMKDIADLDHRIHDLEYYTVITLLEKETQDMQVLDNNGFNMFKNGFVAENFKAYASIDLTNPDIACSLDTDKGYLRPKFTLMNVGGVFDAYNSTAIKSGDFITIPFVNVPFIQQLQASEIMNLQPFNVFTYYGHVDLTPESDEWVDTDVAPAVTINQMGETDIWQKLGAEAFNVQWGSWQKTITNSANSAVTGSTTNFTNISTDTVMKLWNPDVDSSVGADMITAYNGWVASGFTAWFNKSSPDGYANGKPAIYVPFKQATTSQARTGIQNAFDTSKVLTNSLGTDVTDVAIVPYIRPNDITFSAKGMRPNTILYAFFDGVDVTNYCTCSGSNAGVLVTDTNGHINGVFSIPKGMFHIGTRMFRLCDDVANNTNFITTIAEVKYFALGLEQTKREDLLSTREPQLTKIDYSQQQTLSTVHGWDIVPILPTPSPSVTPTSSISATPTRTPLPSYSITPTPTATSPGYPLYVVFFPSNVRDSSLADITFTCTHSQGAFNNIPMYRPGKEISIQGPFYNYRLDFHAEFKVNSNSKGIILKDAFIQAKSNYTSSPVGSISIGNIVSIINDSSTRYTSNGYIYNSSYEQNFMAVLNLKLKPNHVNVVIINGHSYRPSDNTYFPDPLAQEFVVDETLYPEGVYVTGLDMFFKTKSFDVPIRVELRIMVNGYPHATEYIPLTRVMVDPSDVNVSNDASVPTHVQFSGPVYLIPGSYCFCAISDCTDYNVFISHLGDFELGSDTQRITKPTNTGNLFKSSNTVTWIPAPDTCMKFVVYRCSFDTSQEYTVQMVDAPNGTPFIYNTLCMNSAFIKPDRTTMTLPDFYLTDTLTDDFIVTPYNFHMNETNELQGDYKIWGLAPTPTPTISVTPSLSCTVTPTATLTPTPTPTNSNTLTPTPTVTRTVTPTHSVTPSPSNSPPVSVTPTTYPTATPTNTPTSLARIIQLVPSPTPTRSPMIIPFPQPQAIIYPSSTPTPSPALTPSHSPCVVSYKSWSYIWNSPLFSGNETFAQVESYLQSQGLTALPGSIAIPSMLNVEVNGVTLVYSMSTTVHGPGANNQADIFICKCNNPCGYYYRLNSSYNPNIMSVTRVPQPTPSPAPCVLPYKDWSLISSLQVNHTPGGEWEPANLTTTTVKSHLEAMGLTQLPSTVPISLTSPLFVEVNGVTLIYCYSFGVGSSPLQMQNNLITVWVYRCKNPCGYFYNITTTGTAR